MKSILVHPAYFPSIETMAWMAQHSNVTLEVCDNYQKQTYRNRCYIAHSNGILALNIPIRHARDGQRQKTNDVIPESQFSWQRDHWRSIQTAYRTSPYFEFYEDEFAPLFKKAPETLLQLNRSILNLILELLQLAPSITETTSYDLKPLHIDKRSLINCKKPSAVNFKKYHQVFGNSHGFLANLSILDLLFNEGPNSVTYLEELQLT